MESSDTERIVAETVELIVSADKDASALVLKLATLRRRLPSTAYDALRQKYLEMFGPLLEGGDDPVAHPPVGNGKDGVNGGSWALPAALSQSAGRDQVPSEIWSETGVQPGIPRHAIRQQDVANKLARGAFFIDVVLIFMLCNRDLGFAVTLADIGAEFARIGYHEKPDAIRTRLSRMRKAGMVEPAGNRPRTGRYQLTSGGWRAAAAAARERSMTVPDPPPPKSVDDQSMTQGE